MRREFLHSLGEVVRAADCMSALREVCGFIENGTGTAVMISQDDATREWVVLVGKRGTYTGRSLVEAIEAAAKGKT